MSAIYRELIKIGEKLLAITRAGRIEHRLFSKGDQMHFVVAFTKILTIDIESSTGHSNNTGHSTTTYRD